MLNAEVSEFLLSHAVAIPESGCWLWTRCVNKFGYGRLLFRTKYEYAHRITYRLTNGAIPKGMIVCHKCDVPACVNPSHLFLGTHHDNMRDASCKKRLATGDKNGKRRYPELVANGSAKITSADVLSIRTDCRPRKVIAEEFGISYSQVGMIKNRTRWRHVA